MGYLASHVATVPTNGFEWFLIFLESDYSDKSSINLNAAISNLLAH